MENCTLTSDQKIQSNNNFASKIATKRNEALRITRAIKEFYKEKFDVWLPFGKNTFFDNEDKYFMFDKYDFEVKNQYEDLVRMYYNLQYCGIKADAVFEHEGKKATQILSCKYSRHRLDPIWNFRKSRLIRNKYKAYLEKTNYHKDFIPIHLVLTVPHKDGNYKGDTFYVRQIIKDFNLMRKSETFKSIIHAGEYGVEIKKSKTNGYHIHIHSLMFQDPGISIKEAAESIEWLWRKITGNDSKSSGIHYESLYYYKKKESGRGYVTEPKVILSENGTVTYKAVPKKFRINENSTMDEYLKGVMECIKYHFKHEMFESTEPYTHGGYDIETLSYVVKETKNMRLYSRFGAFYKVKELNFNALEKVDENAEDSIEGAEEEYIMNPLDKDIESKIINPFTKEPARPGEYKLAITNQSEYRYYCNSNGNHADLSGRERFYWIRDMPVNFKTLWGWVMKNRLDLVLDDESMDRYYLDQIEPEKIEQFFWRRYRGVEPETTVLAEGLAQIYEELYLSNQIV